MFHGILAAVLLSADEVISKFALTAKKYKAGKFSAITTFGIFLLLIPGIPLFFRLPDGAFLPLNIFLLLSATVLYILFGLLYYEGLRNMRVEQAEPLLLTSGIFAVLLALIFFPEERVLGQVALALIAACSVIFLHLKGKRIVIGKHGLIILLAAGMAALGSIILKELLVIYTPFTLTLIRAGLASIVLIPLFGIDRSDIDDHRVGPIIAVSLIAVAKWIAILWSYDSIGIVRTSIFLSIAPLAAIWGSAVFLREKIHAKNILVTVIIVGCVIGSFFV